MVTAAFVVVAVSGCGAGGGSGAVEPAVEGSLAVGGGGLAAPAEPVVAEGGSGVSSSSVVSTTSVGVSGGEGLTIEDALERGDADAVAAFVAEFGLDSLPEGSADALADAVGEDHLAVAAVLMAFGADPMVSHYTYPRDEQFRPMHYVDSVEMLKMLVAVGIDINATTNWDTSLVDTTLFTGDYDVTLAAVELGAWPEGAAFMAVAQGHTYVLETLFDRGVVDADTPPRPGSAWVTHYEVETLREMGLYLGGRIDPAIAEILGIETN